MTGCNFVEASSVEVRVPNMMSDSIAVIELSSTALRSSASEQTECAQVCSGVGNILYKSKQILYARFWGKSRSDSTGIDDFCQEMNDV